MSDNPNGGDDNTELFNFGLNVDPESAKSGLEQFDAAVNQSAENAAQAAAAIENNFANIEEAISNASANSNMDAWSASMREYNNQVNQADAAWQAVGDSIQADTERLNAMAAAAQNVADASAQVSTGGGIDSGDGGGDSSSGGGLSMAVPRALNSAGSMTREPALRDIAGIMYIQKALEQLQPQFQQLGDIIGLTTASTEEMIASFSLVAVAIVAVVAAVKIVVDEFNGLKKGFDDALQSVDVYYKAIQTGTTESINAELKKLEVTKQSADEELAFLEAQRSAAEVAYHQSDLYRIAVATSGLAAAEALSPANAFNDAIKKLKDSSEQTQTAIDGNARALNSWQVAANDLAANLDAGVAAIEKNNQYEVQRLTLMEQGTAKQVEAELQKNLIQQQANDATIQHLVMLRNLAGTTEEYDKISAQITTYMENNSKLQFEYQDLSNNILPVIENADRLKNALGQVGGGLADLGSMVGPDTFDYLAQKDALQNKYDDQKAADDAAFKETESTKEKAFQTKKSQETADFNTKIARDLADFNAKQADDTKKLYASANDITAKANDKAIQDRIDLTAKEAQIDTDLADKIAEIRQKAHADELDAAENLDSRKIAQLQRSEAQQIDTATNAANKQKSKLEAETEKKISDEIAVAQKERDLKLAQGLQQIQDQQDQFDIKREREIADNTERMNREQQAHNDQMAQDQKNYDDKQAKVLAQYIKEQDALTQHYKDLIAVHNQGSKSALDVAAEFWNKFKAMIPSAPTTQSTQPATTFNPNTPGVPQSATYGIGDLSGYASQYLTAGQTQAIWQAQNPATGMDGQNMPLLSGNSLPSPDTSSIPTSNWYSQQYQHFAEGGVPAGFWAGENGPEFVENKGGVPLVHNNRDSIGMLDKLRQTTSDVGAGAGAQSTTDNSSKQTNIYINGKDVTGDADRDKVRGILLETLKGL